MEGRVIIFHVFLDVLVPKGNSNVALSKHDFLEQLGHVPTHDSFLGLMLFDVRIWMCHPHNRKSMPSSSVLKTVHAY